jgi:hypothetical protein
MAGYSGFGAPPGFAPPGSSMPPASSGFAQSGFAPPHIMQQPYNMQQHMGQFFPNQQIGQFFPSQTPQVVTIASSITIKLTSENYMFWRAQVGPLLRSHLLMGYVDGSFSCPDPHIIVSHAAT